VSNNGIQNFTDFYAHPSASATANSAATIFNVQAGMPRACTFNMMSVVIRSTNITGPTFGPDRLFTYTLNVNEADTPLSCSSTSVLNTNVFCSSSTAVAVAAGDLIALRIQAAGAIPTPGGRIMIGLHCQ
jgi:hypothetical protein